MVALGIGGWVVGDTLWDILDSAKFAPASGWYDVLNVLYVSMYVVMFVGLVKIANPHLRHNAESIADTAVVFLTAVLLLQIFVVNPGLATGSKIDWFAEIYPFGDALLLAAVGSLVFTVASRNPALWLLGVGLGLLIGVDTAWVISQQFTPLTGLIDWVNAAYPISYAVIASAVLHPAAAHIANGSDTRAIEVRQARVVLLCVALGLIPIGAFLGSRDDPLVAVLTTVLVVAIGVRVIALMRAIQNAHERFTNVASAVPVGIFETDAAHNVVFANDQAIRLAGTDPVGVNATQLIGVADERDQPALHQAVAALVAGKTGSVQFRYPDAADVQHWFTISAVPTQKKGKFNGGIVAITEITAIKEAEEMRALQATHDTLTGLPNRRLLFDRLTTALDHVDRQPGQVALLFLDLDGFKPINDRYGHNAGDELLILVANRIVHTVRSEDTVARLGGDEFVVILERVIDRADATAVAEKIIRAITEPAVLSQAEVTVGVSVGIAMSGDPRTDPDRLIQDADSAMYEAKSAGGRRSRFADVGVSRHPLQTQ
ncbi:sensor domain-containing diguanylate cyclase [Mycolicibacterium austroafricanum]|uniref:sensor domain-containing diguanylate cyclase n=1 Tax=Mycolicibacterium austroafricanum TaxID=39687 RepID=UPI001CA31F36|nr:sensor domain-containing diguanylate cyclase [Mycolicibacterium austroafricanum]QZT61721.1 sensor domain-containing diguanylate cyclase [Mycolicibacterium austroafricanum]